MNDAHHVVLDRAEALKTARQFKGAIDLLNSMVDYGTNLIVRAFHSSPRDIKATCTIFVMLRQHVVHLDGLSLLLANGACGTAGLQLRSILENTLLLDWMLNSDSERKAEFLFVSNIRRIKHTHLSVLSGTTESQRRPENLKYAKLTSEQEQGLRRDIQQADAMLSKPPLDAVNQRFEPFYRKNHRDQEWYKAFGVSSIRKVFEAVGRLDEYAIIYNQLSGVTHGSDIFKSITLGRGVVELSPLREFQELPTLLQLAAGFSIEVYRRILKEYRFAELDNFALMYAREWRDEFLKKYQVSVDTVLHHI